MAELRHTRSLASSCKPAFQFSVVESALSNPSETTSASRTNPNREGGNTHDSCMELIRAVSDSRTIQVVTERRRSLLVVNASDRHTHRTHGTRRARRTQRTLQADARRTCTDYSCAGPRRFLSLDSLAGGRKLSAVLSSASTGKKTALSSLF